MDADKEVKKITSKRVRKSSGEPGRNRSLNLSLPPALIVRLKAIALLAGVDPSDLVADWIEDSFAGSSSISGSRR